MFFFTGLIFLAQVIVTSFLIFVIEKYDKIILALTKDLEKSRIKLIWRLRMLEDITGGFNDIMPYLKKKAGKILLKIIKMQLKEATVYSFLIFIKPKYKKLLLLIKLLSGITKEIKRRQA